MQIRGLHKYVAVMVLAVLAFGRQSKGQDQVPWAPDLNTAQRVAQQMNKLVLMHFSSPDCAPCRRLEGTVFRDRWFAEQVAENYVPVQIDVSIEPAIAYQYGVRRWPMDVVTTPDGRTLHKMVSPQDAQAYVDALDSVAMRQPDRQSDVSGNGVEIESRSPRWPEAGLTSHYVRPERQTGYRNDRPEQDRVDSARAPADYYRQPQDPRQRTPYDDVYEQYSRDYGAETQRLLNGRPPENQPNPQRNRAWPKPAEVYNHYAFQGREQNAMDDRTDLRPTVDDERPMYDPPGSTRADGPNDVVDSRLSDNPRSNYDPPSANRPSFRPDSVHADGNRSAPRGNDAYTSPSKGPSGTPPATIGMDGYCPITLVERSQWIKGDERWGLEHRGRIYLFESDEARNKFWANPDRYSPALSGIDSVELFSRGQRVEGKRRHGLVYKDQIYLFSSEGSLRRFYEDPDRFADQTRLATRAMDQPRHWR